MILSSTTFPAANRPSLGRVFRVQATSAKVNRGRKSNKSSTVDDPERGWWEVPINHHYANPLENLTPWQVRKLETAYAIGRRKVQVSALSEDLGLDRAVVVEWFKMFSQRPVSERSAIVSERQHELGRQESRQRATRLVDDEDEKGAGFIPFKVRRQQPRDKKIKQDVLRTLEMVFERHPFPSDDVIKSLWDLHKIPRVMAVEWFASKRKQLRSGSSSVAEKQSTSTASPRAGDLQDWNYVGRPAKDAVSMAESTSTDNVQSPMQPPKPSTSGQAAGAKAGRTAPTDTSELARTTASGSVNNQQSLETLAIAYGEVIVRASRTEEGMMDLLGTRGPQRSWKQVMTRYYMKKGLPRHKQIDRSFWLRKLIVIHRSKLELLKL